MTAHKQRQAKGSPSQARAHKRYGQSLETRLRELQLLSEQKSEAICELLESVRLGIIPTDAEMDRFSRLAGQ